MLWLQFLASSSLHSLSPGGRGSGAALPVDESSRVAALVYIHSDKEREHTVLCSPILLPPASPLVSMEEQPLCPGHAHPENFSLACSALLAQRGKKGLSPT